MAMSRALLSSLLILAAPALAQEPASAAAAGRLSVSAVAERADALHRRRDEAALEKEQETLLLAALKDAPEDYGLLWRMARLRHWQADGAKGEAQGKLGKEGWDWGDKAIRVNPQGVEGQYFAGISVGAYSTGIGVLRALGEGIEGKYNKRVDTALQLDAMFDRGGPLVAKGRYHFELPWPMRDYGKSAALLRKVVEKHPGRIRAGVYLAETLLADGKAEEAKKILEATLAQPPVGDPPEDRRALGWGRALEPKIRAALK